MRSLPTKMLSQIEETRLGHRCIREIALTGLVLILLAATAQLRGQSRAVLTDLGQVRNLTREEADSHLPVSVTAVVTYHDPVKKHLFVQDAHAGVYVYLREKPTELTCGDVLRLEAKTAAGDFKPILVDAELNKLVQPVAPPHARVTTLKELLTGRWDCQRVALEGEVRSVSQTPTGIDLRLVSGGREVTAQVREKGRSPAMVEALIESVVRIEAVCGITADTKRRPREVQLYSCGWSDVLVLKPSPPNPFSRPITSVARLASVPIADLDARLHLRGVIERVTEEGIVLRDPTGAVRVESAHTQRFSKGETVDVLGFPVAEDEAVVIAHSLIRAHRGTVLPLTFSKIAEVRQLSVAEASRAHPVQLRGVVTFCSGGMLFLADDTGGIYIRAKADFSKVSHGDLVDVRGITDPGKFAPVVLATQPVRVIGKGSLPPPREWTVESLLRGNLDCQRIEVSGVVLSQDSRAGCLELVVATRNRVRINVKIWGSRPRPSKDDWVDAEVRVTGVCKSLFTNNRQLTGVELLAPGSSSVTEIAKPAADPFAIPLQTVAGLRGYNPSLQSGHRVRLRGTVTSWRPPFIFLADNTGSLFASTVPGSQVRVGDEVEMVGFPSIAAFAPVVEKAIVRKVGAGSLPQPLARLPLDSRDAGELDATLLRLDARLIDVVSDDREAVLVLGSPRGVFHASLRHSDGPLPPLRLGSLLRLTGVCSVQLDELRQAKSFRLLLRSPDDVLVLSQPSWWTFGRFVAAAGVMAIVLALFVVWTVTLKKKVNIQTEQIKHRLELEAALEKGYRDLFENAEELIQNVSLDGRFLYVNPAWRRFLKYTSAEIKTLSYLDAIDPDKRGAFADLFEAAKAGRAPDKLETVLIDSCGERLPVIGSMVHQVGEAGESVQAIFHDITEKLRLENELRQAQKMESVGRLAAGIAHDFNNLLTIIRSNTSLLLSCPSVPTDERQSLQQIAQATNRAAELTRHLLMFGRKQPLKVEPLDLNKLIVDSIRQFKPEIGRDVEIHLELGENLPAAQGDPAMIGQCLVNLVSNALDAMPQGGAITIRTELLGVDETIVRARPEATVEPCVCLTVADSGVGIDKALLPRIFDPFFSTKGVGKGSGLGLATVYGIVKQHGGWVDVTSAPGRGSSFRLCLPRSTALPAQETIPARVQPVGGETLMMVEDEELIGSLAKRVLEKRGYHVLLAKDGHEALKIWQRQRAAIDLVISDVTMPGMSGYELLDKLRGERPELKAILCSGCAGEIAAEAGGERTVFLPKPYEYPTFLAVVRDCLGRGAQS